MSGPDQGGGATATATGTAAPTAAPTVPAAAAATPAAAAAATPAKADAPAPDPWLALRAYTPARIGLGRAGPALPTRELLAFGLAHARARDAVHAPLDEERLLADVAAALPGAAVLRLHSAAPDRETYLARPDLGRRLDAASAALLDAQPRPAAPLELAVVLADGLSPAALQRHAAPLLAALRERSPGRWSAARLVLARQARVALGDEVGARLGARLAVLLVGERPGLSSPDSLGAYLTSGPRPGRTDAERWCLSNIRPEGLPCAEAARRLDALAEEALRTGRTGTALPGGGGSGLLPR